MQELDSFKAQLKTLWSPSVAVIASEEAEKLCWGSNGLTVTELLRPFGVLRKMNKGMGVPIRTPAEQPIRLYDWNLNFYDVDELKQTPPEVANQHLAEYLKRAASGTGDVPPVELLLEAVGADDVSPWYPEYCTEFFRMLKFGSHESVDHPVACILVLPSTFEGEASSSFADLFEERAPPLLKHLVRDSYAVIHYAIVHDSRTAGPEAQDRALAALQTLTSSYGPPGHLLNLYSNEMPRVTPAVWEECVKQRWEQAPSSPSSGPATSVVASGLSQADAGAIAASVEELAVRKIAPHVESRIRQLDQSVLAARKGFKNQLKSMFFRKAAPSTPDGSTPGQSPVSPRPATSPRSPTNSSQYAPSSPEAQLRRLSDLAMMVGDYETALSTLRLLASDYKADKAYMYYAGSQEAMAAATVLADGPPSDAVANFKEAFYRYDQVAQQAPSRATWYATRAAMLMAGYLTAIGRYSDASWIVMKAHFGEEDLRAALLIERAAFLLLRVRPARIRKFAFHLVLAGLRYSKGGARELAARAYSLAIEVYQGHNWEVVEEHVREALGKGCMEMGDAAEAVQHFAATLLCSQIPAGLQSFHMTQFAEALQAATAQLGYTPVVDLQLPIINTTKVGVSSSGQASYANVNARQMPRRVWSTLESAIGPPQEAAPTWMDGSSRVSLANAGAESLTCCVGEDVGIDLEITNPLHIELMVTKLRLCCTFEAPGGQQPPPQGTPAVAPTVLSTQQPSSTGPAATSVTSLSTQPFQLREERITLHPGERAVVHLRVRPLRTGALSIDGVSWDLNGVASGQKAFTIKKRIIQNKGASQAALAIEDAEQVGGLHVKIMPPMPRLVLSLEGLPSTLLVGQVAKCSLKLKNAGAMTLHALRCSIDSPSVFLQVTPSQPVTTKQDTTIFAIGASKLGVNEEMELAFYVRPTRPGPFEFNLCWYYEPLVKLEALPYRTLRASFHVSALPSLEMMGWSSPLPGTDGRLLLLRGLNLQGIETFTLKSFSLVGGRWHAVRAGQQGSDVAPATTVGLDHVVGPESAVVVHALLSRVAEGENAEEQQDALPQALQYLSSKEFPALPAAAVAPNAAYEPPSRAILQWKATGLAEGVVEGFNNVYILRSRDGSGVTARLIGPPTIAYDFAAAPACSIALTLELSHELPGELQIRWGTSRDHPGNEPAPSGETLQGQRFFWSGRTSATLPAVLPGILVKVPLRIAVCAPGWVSIEGCWVEWSCKEAPQLAGGQREGDFSSREIGYRRRLRPPLLPLSKHTCYGLSIEQAKSEATGGDTEQSKAAVAAGVAGVPIFYVAPATGVNRGAKGAASRAAAHNVNSAETPASSPPSLGTGRPSRRINHPLPPPLPPPPPFSDPPQPRHSYKRKGHRAPADQPSMTRTSFPSLSLEAANPGFVSLQRESLLTIKGAMSEPVRQQLLAALQRATSVVEVMKRTGPYFLWLDCQAMTSVAELVGSLPHEAGQQSELDKNMTWLQFLQKVKYNAPHFTLKQVGTFLETLAKLYMNYMVQDVIHALCDAVARKGFNTWSAVNSLIRLLNPLYLLDYIPNTCKLLTNNNNNNSSKIWSSNARLELAPAAVSLTSFSRKSNASLAFCGKLSEEIYFKCQSYRI